MDGSSGISGGEALEADAAALGMADADMDLHRRHNSAASNGVGNGRAGSPSRSRRIHLQSERLLTDTLAPEPALRDGPASEYEMMSVSSSKQLLLWEQAELVTSLVIHSPATFAGVAMRLGILLFVSECRLCTG